MELIRFEENKKYYMRSSCNYDYVWVFEVIKRTAKSILLLDEDGKLIKKAIKHDDKTEFCLPLGSYSMSPVLRATRELRTNNYNPENGWGI